MLRLIAVASALAFASSAQAMPLAPPPQADILPPSLEAAGSWSSRRDFRTGRGPARRQESDHSSRARLRDLSGTVGGFCAGIDTFNELRPSVRRRVDKDDEAQPVALTP
jgi:hypothetical protein